MLKKIVSLLSFIIIIQYVAIAQIPNGYYNTATGLTGAPLKTALYNIIKGHTERTYANLWTDFQLTDKKANGKVWDMYSDIPGGIPPYEYTFVSNQCGNYSSEGDCYNREHSFPKSWFNDGTPMYTDLFHIVPTDGKVNGERSNDPFGKVNSPSWTSQNGSKVGPNVYPGYTGTVFEPIDSFKGDFARNYFYMVTRYENLISGWVTDMLDNSTYPAFTVWAKNMLIEWNNLDPVSTKEINRNNAVYGIQHNRNPYIDHPEYVSLVWGGGSIILVNAITVQALGGATSITTQGGSLQMAATVLPSNASNASFTWSVKNQTATINSSGLLTAVSDGIDTVIATANDGSGVKGYLAINISNQGSGINYIDLSDKIAVYPNPAVDELNIDIKKIQLLPDNISVTDIRGKKVYQLTTVSHHQTIDVTGLEKGMYFITISGINCKSVIKFIR